MLRFLDRFRGPTLAVGLDPGDRQVLKQLQAAGADLAKPRDTVHWSYFPDQARAEQAGRRLAAAGYTVDIAPPTEQERRTWQVRANHLAVVGPATFPPIRALMEQVAQENGGEYDGWEAAAQP